MRMPDFHRLYALEWTAQIEGLFYSEGSNRVLDFRVSTWETPQIRPIQILHRGVLLKLTRGTVDMFPYFVSKKFSAGPASLGIVVKQP